jgi:4-amino-4-deoxy-L-arabinose transferase-like glycosyltransferase
MVLVGLGLLAFYLAIQRGEWVSWDGRQMAGVARNIWEHGRLQLFGDSFGAAPASQRTNPFTVFGIGMSLLMAPLWALQLMRDPNGAFWLTTVNPALTAITGVLLYRIGRDLGFRRVSAVIAALAFGLLTLAPVYSTELFSEPGVTLAIVVVLWGLLGWGKGRASGPWLVGVGAAWAVLFRYDSFLTVAPVVLAAPLFVSRPTLVATWRRWLPAIAVPLGAATAWTAYYNNLRYGSPLKFGGNEHAFSYPILQGLERQLLSPGKGFFLYSPILLAALPGLVWLWRRNRGVAAVVIGLCVLRVVVFSRYFNPDGSVAWGPRYLVPACALLALGLGETVEHVRSLRGRLRTTAVLALLGLTVASATVVVASVWVPYDYTWTVTNDIPGWQQMPVGQLNRMKEQRALRQFDDPYWSPIALNLRTIAHPRRLPLRWFRGGPSTQGIVLLTLAIAGVASALAVAVHRESEQTRGEGLEADTDPSRNGVHNVEPARASPS